MLGERSHAIPLTFACSSTQLSCWVNQQLSPGEPPLQISVRWHITGHVPQRSLLDAWRELIARHDALRCAIWPTSEEPMMVLETDIPFVIPVFDLRDTSGRRCAGAVERLARIEAQTSMDLTRAPLLRVTRVDITDTDLLLLVTVHQIVADRATLGILMGELHSLLTAAFVNSDAQLVDAPSFVQLATAERAEANPQSVLPLREIARQLLHGSKQVELMRNLSRWLVPESHSNL